MAKAFQVLQVVQIRQHQWTQRLRIEYLDPVLSKIKHGEPIWTGLAIEKADKGVGASKGTPP